MRQLNRLTQATASYSGHHTFMEASTTTAVWAPGRLRRTGVLRAHAAEGIFTYDTTFGWAISMRDFQQYTGLGPLLCYLGIRTDIQGPGDIEVNYPRPQVIAERAAQVNTTLSAGHKLPLVTVYDGAAIPADRLIRSWVDDELLLPTGGHPRPFRRLGKNALIAAHGVAVSLPSRLAMDPASRDAVAEQCSNVLDDPGEPDINGNTKVELLAGAITRFVAPPNMGAAKFGNAPEPLVEMNGTESVLHHLSNFEAGGTQMPRERAAELGQLSLEHTAFLREHVIRLPQPA